MFGYPRNVWYQLVLFVQERRSLENSWGTWSFSPISIGQWAATIPRNVASWPRTLRACLGFVTAKLPRFWMFLVWYWGRMEPVSLQEGKTRLHHLFSQIHFLCFFFLWASWISWICHSYPYSPYFSKMASTPSTHWHQKVLCYYDFSICPFALRIWIWTSRTWNIHLWTSLRHRAWSAKNAGPRRSLVARSNPSRQVRQRCDEEVSIERLYVSWVKVGFSGWKVGGGFQWNWHPTQVTMYWR